MCGRFFLSANLDEILAALGATETAFDKGDFKPRYNIAPTQEAAVLSTRRGGERVLGTMRWNLRPHFWTPGKPELALINLRMENAFQKPVWRRLLERHRCVIPFSGFYEWQPLGEGKGARKQPLRIAEPGQVVSAFAGVWDRWEGEGEGERMLSFSILTMPANAALEGVHNRMPVVLTPNAVDTWLDRSMEDTAVLEKTVRSAERTRFTVVPVSTRVNSPRNDDASLIEPL